MASGDDDSATIQGPAPGGVALLIIDMINAFDFDGAEQLLPKAEALSRVILSLRDQADRLKIPVVYVNDNFGHWHSERSRLVEACTAKGLPGAAIVRSLAPRDGDFFIIKPQFSGFYATNLPVLIPKLGVDRLVLTGIAADICVLFTAADAHMRDYGLWAPSDAIASEADEETRWALGIMRKSMAAETRKSGELTLEAWVRSARPKTNDGQD